MMYYVGLNNKIVGLEKLYNPTAMFLSIRPFPKIIPVLGHKRSYKITIGNF